MAIVGAVLTDDQVAQFQDAPKSWRRGVLIDEPNGYAPLYALTNVLRSKTIKSEEHYWWEEDYPKYQCKLAATTGTSDPATFTLTTADGDDEATLFQVGDRFRVEQSGEVVEVVETPTSTTSLKVARAKGAVSATAVNPATSGYNYYITFIGNAFEENSAAPEGRIYKPTKVYNYLQTERTALEVGGRAIEVEKRDEDWYAKAARQMRTKHSIAIERTLFWGEKSDGFRNGRRLTTMDGVIAFIPDGTGTDPDRQFAPSSGTTFSYDELEEWMYNIFLYGSSEKVCFCGGRFEFGLIQALRKMKYANINMEMTGSQKEYGMSVRRLMVPNGTLVIKTHPMFSHLASGTNSTAFTSWDAKAVVLDLADIVYCPLKNRDTKMEKNLEIPGTDGKKEGLLTDFTIEVHHPKHHALISGVLGGKAES